jgi:hypothetical protein
VKLFSKSNDLLPLVVYLVPSVSLYIAFEVLSDPNAEIGSGIAFFYTAPILALFYVGRVVNRRRRDGGVSGVSSEVSSVGEGKRYLVTPILSIVFSYFYIIGFPLALYGYFGNKAGSKARLLGLIGVCLNVLVMLWLIPDWQSVGEVAPVSP